MTSTSHVVDAPYMFFTAVRSPRTISRRNRGWIVCRTAVATKTPAIMHRETVPYTPASSSDADGRQDQHVESLRQRLGDTRHRREACCTARTPLA